VTDLRWAFAVCRARIFGGEDRDDYGGRSKSFCFAPRLDPRAWSIETSLARVLRPGGLGRPRRDLPTGRRDDAVHPQV
jgi:hypothetical protein